MEKNIYEKKIYNLNLKFEMKYFRFGEEAGVSVTVGN